MRRKRFFEECLQAAQTVLAHPIRVFFDVSDVVNSSLAQANACIPYVSFWIKEVSLIPIDIDCRIFCFHRELPSLLVGWFSCTIARPIVTSLFEFESKLFPPASNDSPCHHHMDVIGNDVVQEALIVRN